MNVLGKQPIVRPQGTAAVIRLRSLMHYCIGKARPPANWLKFVVAWEYDTDPCSHQLELCSSKQHPALAPPPPETNMQVDATLEIGDVQVDESECSDASQDSQDSYDTPRWLLGVQHDSLAECRGTK